MKKKDYLIKVSTDQDNGDEPMVHIRNIGGTDHVTMCGLDGSDPCCGQETFELKRGDKMNCTMCGVAYDNRKGLNIKKSWIDID